MWHILHFRVWLLPSSWAKVLYSLYLIWYSSRWSLCLFINKVWIQRAKDRANSVVYRTENESRESIKKLENFFNNMSDYLLHRRDSHLSYYFLCLFNNHVQNSKFNVEVFWVVHTSPHGFTTHKNNTEIFTNLRNSNLNTCSVIL